MLKMGSVQEQIEELQNLIADLEKTIPQQQETKNSFQTAIFADNTNIATTNKQIAALIQAFFLLPADVKAVLNQLMTIDKRVGEGIHKLIAKNALKFSDPLEPSMISSDGKVYIDM